SWGERRAPRRCSSRRSPSSGATPRRDAIWQSHTDGWASPTWRSRSSRKRWSSTRDSSKRIRISVTFFSSAATAKPRCATSSAPAVRRAYPEALNCLGDAQLASGKYEAACANLERAVGLDPGFHEAWYNLSRARTQWAFAATSGDAAPSPVTEHAERGLESIVA